MSGSRKSALRSISRRSEEHTSELQSQSNLVCRLLLEKKNTQPAIDSALNELTAAASPAMAADPATGTGTNALGRRPPDPRCYPTTCVTPGTSASRHIR